MKEIYKIMNRHIVMHPNILFYWLVNFKTPLPTLVYYIRFITSSTTIEIKDVNKTVKYLDSPTFCLLYSGIILEHKFDKDKYNQYEYYMVKNNKNNSYIRLSPLATQEIISNVKIHDS